MWLTIGDVVVPAPGRDLIEDAYRHQNAKTRPHDAGWHGWGGFGWWGYASSPLWYATVTLWAGTNYYYADEEWVGNGYWWGYASTVLADAGTAALLDAAFAGAASPEVVLADGQTEVACGEAFLQSKTALRLTGGGAIWAYTFICLPKDRYRTRATRRHAWTWAEVMLDAYPLAGEPVTSGPSLYDPAAETDYVYGGYYGYYNAGWYYAGGFDVQLDSGCRFGQTLSRVATGGREGPARYELSAARFWTVEEATATADAQWLEHGPRIVFGGRTDIDDLGGNLPATVRATYAVNPSTTVNTLDTATGAANAAGRELLELGGIESAANLSAQVAAWVAWETHRRRNHQTVFAGLVPWAMTPFDTFVQFHLPIDGHQIPATAVHGGAYRYRQTDPTDVANPAPAGGTITVTFTRPASPTAGHDTPAAGSLTRDGFGSSPAFSPPISGTSTSYVYDSLADGAYTVAPGAPWTPTSATATVANGSSHTLNFTVPPP